MKRRLMVHLMRTPSERMRQRATAAPSTVVASVKDISLISEPLLCGCCWRWCSSGRVAECRIADRKRCALKVKRADRAQRSKEPSAATAATATGRPFGDRQSSSSNVVAVGALAATCNYHSAHSATSNCSRRALGDANWLQQSVLATATSSLVAVHSLSQCLLPSFTCPPLKPSPHSLLLCLLPSYSSSSSAEVRRRERELQV